MTDKQIIDGVDVSGCLFYQTNFEEDYDVKIKHYCSNWHNSCESNNNTNCYYKNWQRAEQKLEKIKETVKYYAEIRCEDCKYLSVKCVDCNEVIAQEVIQIIEGK